MRAERAEPGPPRRRAGRDVILQLNNLNVSYGSIAAVKGLSLTVYDGEIVTLIGSNGAGKSTTLRTISGLLRPRSGEVMFNGKNIVGIPGHNVVKMGIAQSPEGRKIFQRMTVSENLDLGAFVRDDTERASPPTANACSNCSPACRNGSARRPARCPAASSRCSPWRAHCWPTRTLLLLDEPSMGLAPVLVDLIFETIQTIRDQGVTVLLVEQNALAALEIADYAYVLESGHLNMEGPAEQLLEDDSVAAAYLGG